MDEKIKKRFLERLVTEVKTGTESNIDLISSSYCNYHYKFKKNGLGELNFYCGHAGTYLCFYPEKGDEIILDHQENMQDLRRVITDKYEEKIVKENKREKEEYQKRVNKKNHENEEKMKKFLSK